MTWAWPLCSSLIREPLLGTKSYVSWAALAGPLCLRAGGAQLNLAHRLSTSDWSGTYLTYSNGPVPTRWNWMLVPYFLIAAGDCMPVTGVARLASSAAYGEEQCTWAT
jgi:hypothetical protein